MGVPSFFAWLAKKFPKVLIDVAARELDVAGQPVPIDTSEPNPNGIEFDNLYLDMNGIIHPCVHPENRDAPETEEQMIEDIFEYIDVVFGMVRPRRLLYMAIDGVAPRAKMNQQRSRRFKSIQEAAERARVEELMQAEVEETMRNRGKEPPPRKPKKQHFDYNCITPGTEFMDKIATALRYYVSQRVSTDPGWKDVQVIISDATVPGEGEHKLMEFIRNQRTQKDYDPNTVHCIYGLDADLIMLTMATHELRFSVLREEVDNKRGNVCRRCAQPGHQEAYCTGEKKKQAYLLEGTQFQFLDIPTLKEYLELELKPVSALEFEWDLERACDDFVLLCFLVGNDFLPHMPTLSIREGAIDLLMGLYKAKLPELGGWISDSGVVNFARLGVLVDLVSPMEEQILLNQVQEQRDADTRRARNSDRAKNDFELAQAQQAQLRGDEAVIVPDAVAHETEQLLAQRRRESREELSKQPVKNEVRLGEAGWRDRYYRVKFHRDDGLQDGAFIKRVAESFCRGLAWVLQYYYQGVDDWEWYFEFHYAPFASDLSDFVDWTHFAPLLAPPRTTQPFKPLEQLMAVLPPQSACFLPPCLRPLMTASDSPIGDYYPQRFEVDMEGIPAQLSYLGVVLLPFIDSKRLVAATQPLEALLTEAERARNGRGRDFVFTRSSRATKLAGAMRRCMEAHDANAEMDVRDTECNLFGLLRFFPDSVVHASGYAAPWASRKLKPVEPNWALCCFFAQFARPPGGYVARALPNARALPALLTDDDKQRRQLTSRGASGRLLRAAMGPELYDRLYGNSGGGGGGGNGPSRRNSSRELRPGQWVCRQCTRTNSESDTSCFVCDLPASRNGDASVTQWPDWACINCSRVNGPWRWDCDQCKTRKAGLPPPRNGGGGVARRGPSSGNVNMRAFDAEAPSQGVNPYAAPAGHYSGNNHRNNSSSGGHSGRGNPRHSERDMARHSERDQQQWQPQQSQQQQQQQQQQHHHHRINSHQQQQQQQYSQPAPPPRYATQQQQQQQQPSFFDYAQQQGLLGQAPAAAAPFAGYHPPPPEPSPYGGSKRAEAPREIHYDRTADKRARPDAPPGYIHLQQGYHAAPALGVPAQAAPAPAPAQQAQLQKLQEMHQLLATMRSQISRK